MNDFLTFLKEKGFVYPGSQIYGGLANTWDYGPLGSILKNNLKKLWIKEFIYKQPNNFLLDTSIFLNPKVWQASGHVDKFNDPLIDCKKCKNRFRADKLVEEEFGLKNISNEEMTQKIQSELKCPNCGKQDWSDVREFKLMFETSNSKTSDDLIYLRPETAQGIFIDFNSYKEGIFGKIPFGIGQIGKAFRNEVTPGNFIFRTKEFEQMELEYFVYPDDEDENLGFNFYLQVIKQFLKKIGLKKENIKSFNVPKNELAHYSKRTIDFEYNFPFGWGELLGIANRSNFDLTNHSKNSDEKLSYFENKERYVPSVIETSMGVERLLFAILWETYNLKEHQDNQDFMDFTYALAPYKLAILPLTKAELEFAKKIEAKLHDSYVIENTLLIEKGSIGKRYKRIDEIGIPFAITVDEKTLKEKTITIREGINKNQTIIKISDLEIFLLDKIK